MNDPWTIAYPDDDWLRDLNAVNEPQEVAARR